jgi:DNA-binding NarL/FixJ family response regulator
MEIYKNKKVIKKHPILIVEDHDKLRKSLRQWLSSSFPECVFFEAETGEDAIDQTTSHIPEIILMDIALPGISGIEATRRIRKELPGTYVVILTIHDEEGYKADAESAGAFAFVPKHKMYTELLPIIRTLLSTPDNSH